MACLNPRPWAIIGLCFLAQAAGAKPGTPGPDYFAGVFERVGRDAAGAMLNDFVTIAPAGETLTISACTGPALNLSFGPAFEIVNIMTGSQNGDAVECLFHNNGYNYPILTCRSEGGAAFTLWPTTTKAMSC